MKTHSEKSRKRSHVMRGILSTMSGLLFSLPAPAENVFIMSAGIDYSSGKYGNDASTDILYIPVTGKYIAGDWTLKLTIPYISITGPGGVVPGMGRIGPMFGGTMSGGGMMGVGGTGATKTTQSGIGDVTASAGYRSYSTEALAIDLVGSIKFGTANANKGLGTGRNDYALQIDGYYSIGAAMLFATAGYKVKGSPPEIRLSNIPYGSIGVSRKLNSVMTIGGMFDMAQSAAPATPGTREASLYIADTVAHDIRMTASILKGFSDSSPDFGASLTFGRAF